MNTIIKREVFFIVSISLRAGDAGGDAVAVNRGNVWVSEDDIEEILSLLNTNRINFIKNHTIRSNGRLSLKEKLGEEEFECIFFKKGDGCLIYEARPKQCRDYPFWEIFKRKPEKLFKECPGVIRE